MNASSPSPHDVPTTGDESDVQLLETFRRSGDQQAFALLVSRHSSMVRGVARRITNNGSDADDVTQAVFLALADHVSRGHTLVHCASWLHRVARNVSVNCRTSALVRRHYETKAGTDMIARRLPDGHDPLTCPTELDQALDDLPERYRLPLILHYLEGKNFSDIARTLKAAEGTVASWISRGRTLLRNSLNRRGRAVSEEGIAAILLQVSVDSLTNPKLMWPDLSGPSPSPRVLALVRHAQGLHTTTSLVSIGLFSGVLSALIGLGFMLLQVSSNRWFATESAGRSVSMASTGKFPTNSESAASDISASQSYERLSLADSVRGFYRYRLVDGESVDQTLRRVAAMPLAVIGTWPDDEPAPWTLGNTSVDLDFSSGDITPYISKLTTGMAIPGPLRGGRHGVLALASDVVSANGYWIPQRVERDDHRILITIGNDPGRDMDKGAMSTTTDDKSAVDHTYLYLVDLGILTKGTHRVDITEHYSGNDPFVRCAHATYQISDESRDVNPVLIHRGDLVPEPAHSPKYLTFREHPMRLNAASPSEDALRHDGIRTGGLSLKLFAEISHDEDLVLGSLPTLTEHPVDGWRTVEIVGSVTALSERLTCASVVMAGEECRIELEKWIDRSDSDIMPHRPGMIVWFPDTGIPKWVRVHWSTLVREVNDTVYHPMNEDVTTRVKF